MKLDQNEAKNAMNRLPQSGSMNDELRAEYDLARLRVRKFGSSRTKFSGQELRFAFDGVEEPQCGNRE